MKPTVFIHTNAAQLLGAKVSAYSLRRASHHAEKFDVQIIELENYPHLTKREGQIFLRGGEPVAWHYAELQSFTLLRYLPPQLMGYEGRSVVIDPDIFAVGDAFELLSRDMEGKAVFARRSGSGRSFKTSCMLMDNAQLRHWQWEKQIDELFAHQRDYMDWNTLGLEPQESIGTLEARWNDFDNMDADTQFLHNTKRATQPWKTGLEYKSLHRSEERKARTQKNESSLKNKVRVLFGKRTATHAAHPDRRQQDLFFGFLRGCLEENLISEQELRAEIERKYLRPDAFRVLDATPPLEHTLRAVGEIPVAA